MKDFLGLLLDIGINGWQLSHTVMVVSVVGIITVAAISSDKPPDDSDTNKNS